MKLGLVFPAEDAIAFSSSSCCSFWAILIEQGLIFPVEYAVAYLAA
jgi:hypothetical protein